MPFRKTENVLARGEHSIGVITESVECFIPQKPRKERVLIAECVCYRVGRNDARTLSEVIAKFDGMRGLDAPDVWELAGVNVVHRHRIGAPELFWSATTCKR